MTDNDPRNDQGLEDDQGRDYILQNIADIADYSGYGLPVTLFFNGMIVSGLVINCAEYLERIARWAEGCSSQKDITDYVSTELTSEAERINETSEGYSAFIHLEKVKILSLPDQPEISHSDLPLRCKISQVDAFVLGRIKI